MSAVRCRREKGIAVLEITETIRNREEMAALAREIGPLCSELSYDKETRVIILGSPVDNAFTMGDDLLEDVKTSAGEAENDLYPISGEIAAIDKPVIAAIYGDAVGLGLEIALACDLRISSDSSNFWFPHLEYGLIPWDGGTQRLSRLVGQGKAMEMILTGERLDAHEACRMGLVNKTMPKEKLEDYLWDVALQVASKAPVSVAYTKEAINRGMDLTLEQGLSLEADLYFLLHTTKDRREGIRAFREKRTPQFKGE